MKCRYRSRSVFQRISATTEPLPISRTCFRVTLVPLIVGGLDFVVDGAPAPGKGAVDSPVAIVLGGDWCGDVPLECFFHHEVTGTCLIIWEYMDPQL